MSRKILFRAYDTVCKVMLQQVSVSTDSDHIGIPYEGSAEDPYTPEQVEQHEGGHLGSGDDWLYVLNGFELMQYTNLNDQEGTEIYEGDIVSVHNKGSQNGVKVVIWDEVNLCWGLLWLAYYRPDWRSSRDEFTFNKVTATLSCTVVGNIYQNTDLLP